MNHIDPGHQQRDAMDQVGGRPVGCAPWDCSPARPPLRSMRGYRLEDASSYTQPTLECDLIMKGGITSGVVYPRAACRLATRYRLRRIGGASAGAIAAALTAAAEYQRRQPEPSTAEGRRAGFVRLAAVPVDLGANLGELFQPTRATRPAHRMLMAALAPGQGRVRRGLAVLGHGFRTGLPTFALTLLVLMLVPVAVWALTGSADSWRRDWRWLWLLLAWLPGAGILALVVSAVRTARRTLGALQGNGFGLTNGHTTDGRGSMPPLTDWMATTIDETAGLAVGPLTFGHLWGADAVTVQRRLHQRQLDGERVTSADASEFSPDIDLQVMVTNLTWRRPHEFPFSSDDFCYCPTCWAAYFPRLVMTHLLQKSPPGQAVRSVGPVDDQQQVPMRCPYHPGVVVRPLPAAADIPVVVAARLSLSFPGLISAVPLLCVDLARRQGQRELVVCWFSDGGIASNFPIHFFDSPWPGHPTFGLNLDDVHDDFPDQLVWRPRDTLGGTAPRSHPPTSMLDFAQAVVQTMQNWLDTSQLTMPGFRDRVTELRLRPGEGGLNLRMTDQLVAALAERGSDAALELDDFDLPLHQWVRYRVMTHALSGSLDQMRTRWLDVGGQEGYARLIRRYATAPGPYRLARADACADAAATARLMSVADDWHHGGYPASALPLPLPEPRIRQMPRL